MELDQHLDGIRTEGETFLARSRDAGLDAPVPTCPGWDVRRMVQHLAKVHQRTEAVVRTRAAEPPRSSEFPRFADDEALFDQAAETLERLLATLAVADLAAPAWTFVDGADGRAAFWPRRMAAETAVHRTDAEAAAGVAVGPVATDLAIDGVGELVEVLLPTYLARQEAEGGEATTPDATIHLHATDAEGEWMITFEGGSLRVERAHGKGDLAVRGPASGLFLWAWNRATPADAGLTTFGDDALLAAWRQLIP